MRRFEYGKSSRTAATYREHGNRYRRLRDTALTMSRLDAHHQGAWGCSSRGRRPPASCIPTPAATGRSWCCNYPPGLPGRLLCLNAALPGGTFLTAQLLRPRWIRHLPMTFGALFKRRVPDDVFRSWIHPLRHNRKVRRDLNKYLTNVPKPTQLLEWADQQRSFAGPVLIIWARHDKLMPPTHAERLAEHFQNAQLVWVDDSRTLIPINQPTVLTDHLHTFLAAHS